MQYVRDPQAVLDWLTPPGVREGLPVMLYRPQQGAIIVSPEMGVIHLTTKSKRYALSVFEGTRAYYRNGRWILLKGREHWARMKEYVERFLLRGDRWMSYEEWERFTLEFIGMVVPKVWRQIYMRHTVDVVTPGLGVNNPKAGRLWQVTIELSDLRGGYYHTSEGLRLVTSTTCRFPGSGDGPSSPAIFGGKGVGVYAGGADAKASAEEAGYNDAILSNGFGLLADCSSSGLVLINRRRRLVVTPTPSAALDSITIGLALEAAQSMGYTACREDVPVTVFADRLRSGDWGLATCGTAAEVAPVDLVDFRHWAPLGVPDGVVNLPTQAAVRLRAAFRRYVRDLIRREAEAA